jgi:hypothetical protein
MSMNYKNLKSVTDGIENRMIMANVVARSLAEGLAPWSGRLPRNFATGKPITGAARFVLNVLAKQRDVRGRHWGSMSEWLSLGQSPLLDDSFALFLDSKKGDRRVLEPAVLYPSDAVIGIVENPSNLQSDYGKADRIFDASGCKLKRRCFNPCWKRKGKLDWIEMPDPENVILGLDGYYSLLFHEMTHWAVLGGRLGESFNVSEHQSEFLTNLSAAIICDRCDIPFLLPVSKVWNVEHIRGLSTPDYLFESIDIAERASTFLLQWIK